MRTASSSSSSHAANCSTAARRRTRDNASAAVCRATPGGPTASVGTAESASNPASEMAASRRCEAGKVSSSQTARNGSRSVALTCRCFANARRTSCARGVSGMARTSATFCRPSGVASATSRSAAGGACCVVTGASCAHAYEAAVARTASAIPGITACQINKSPFRG